MYIFSSICVQTGAFKGFQDRWVGGEGLLIPHPHDYWKCNFPKTRLSGVGRSVYRNFLKGREVTHFFAPIYPKKAIFCLYIRPPPSTFTAFLFAPVQLYKYCK